MICHEHMNDARTALYSLTASNPAISETLMKRKTAAGNPKDLRIIAFSELAAINAQEAARAGVVLINELDSPEQVPQLFDAFLPDRGRVQALGNVLADTRIPDRKSTRLNSSH